MWWRDIATVASSMSRKTYKSTAYDGGLIYETMFRRRDSTHKHPISAKNCAAVIAPMRDMTMPANNIPSDNGDPLIRRNLVSAALGCSEDTVQRFIRDGRLPRPNVKGKSKTLLWRLSDLRRCNPALADNVERLLNLPQIAAV